MIFHIYMYNTGTVQKMEIHFPASKAVCRYNTSEQGALR